MSSNHRHPIRPGDKLAWTIALNVVITIAEFVGGLVSGYLALTADAIHNLSDVAALVLAWFGIKGSQRPATKKSTYGLKRLEVMTALISASALVVIAIFIFIEAYHRFMNPQPLTHPTLFLTVAVIGLVGNILSVWILAKEKDNSLNMKTAFLHMAYDAVSSVGVIAGALVILWTGWTQIDPILSAIIGLMILWSSYLVIREAVLILLEAVPSEIEFDLVHQALLRVPRVRDVHDLHIWSLSSRETALSCHMCVDANDYSHGPEIIERTNHMLQAEFAIGHATIQIETEDCDRAELLCRYNHHE
ncbi:cation transporter [candidate division GN15 bacterium]|uniref:Cation transporter n=1 Tax=candidate division GN15 bacterium TaxID=2072418 RepID=A0A855WZP9_9BACT|nr:MAG: cation transporter [candidate division GN15 bacterium]